MPLGVGVDEVVALAVAADDPVGKLLGIVARALPVAAQRVEPVGVAAAPCRHHGRGSLGGHRHDPAVGRLFLQRLGERRCHEVIGAGTLPACRERHGGVVGIIAPAVADDAVRRGHGARRERGQRDGRDGLLVVVAAVGVADASFREAEEAPLFEVLGVAFEVSGTHRPDDDLDDEPGPGGRSDMRQGGECRQKRERAEFHGA
jgi:hypothetical protein